MIRIFFSPDNTSYVLFTEQVLSHMYAHAQRKPSQKEAGGEIFSSDPNSSGLVINTATGPNPSDYRRRCAWSPDIKASDRNRQAEFIYSRHVVGLWHTHPEHFPTPSRLDQKTTWKYLDSFKGDRSRYLMVIIGNQGPVPEMGVWVATAERGRQWMHLCEAPCYEAEKRLRRLTRLGG